MRLDPQSIKRLRWGAPVLALALLIVGGCSRSGIHVVVNKRYPPRPPGYEVFLTHDAFQEPHERLATAWTRAYEEWELRDRGAVDLCAAARRVGGDAVVAIRKEPVLRERIGYQPTRTFRFGTRLVTTYYYTGVIVRFQAPPPSPFPYWEDVTEAQPVETLDPAQAER